MDNDGRDTPEPTESPPRTLEAVLQMAVVVQANLVQLRNTEAKRRDLEPDAHDIRVRSPGAVRSQREALVDYQCIKSYSEPELHLRLHEVWGQFCLFCWAVHVDDPQAPPAFGDSPSAIELRCPAALRMKAAEVEAFLWRLKFEQRLRHDPTFRGSADFQSDRQIARKIPANVNHLPVDRADDDGLIVCSCEHAGMLAAARWIADQRWSWGQEGIMDLDDPAVRALVQAPPETNDDISNSDVR